MGYTVVIRTNGERKALETMSLYNTSHDSYMQFPLLLFAPALCVARVNKIPSNIILSECTGKAFGCSARLGYGYSPNI
ncbi:MAG: hypothetical protein Q9205_005010 [Flavoplaca limonia]